MRIVMPHNIECLESFYDINLKVVLFEIMVSDREANKRGPLVADHVKQRNKLIIEFSMYSISTLSSIEVTQTKHLQRRTDQTNILTPTYSSNTTRNLPDWESCRSHVAPPLHVPWHTSARYRGDEIFVDIYSEVYLFITYLIWCRIHIIFTIRQRQVYRIFKI